MFEKDRTHLLACFDTAENASSKFRQKADRQLDRLSSDKHRQKLKEENAKLRRELVDGGAAGATPFQQSLVAALTEENEDLKQRLMKIGQDPYVAIEGEAAKSGAGYLCET